LEAGPTLFIDGDDFAIKYAFRAESRAGLCESRKLVRQSFYCESKANVLPLK
jgi:hypothetical protein